MNWRDCSLGDVLTLKRGHDLPNDARQPGEVPVVSSSGITGSHNQAKAEPPGVVTGRYGTLGEVFYLEEPYWPLNTALYVVDFKGTHSRFAAYFLKYVLRNYQSDKAAVPGVDRNVLHELKVRVPARPAQERIASTLARYDALLENNERRMELLEQAMRLLYEEWFVRLRFPGREHTRFENGLPVAWERQRLDQLAMVVMGQSPPSSQYNEDGDGLPFHQGVTDFNGRFERHHTFTAATNRVAEEADILCSVRAPVGRLAIALDKLVVGRGLAAIRSRDNHQSFLYYQLKNHFFKEDLIGSGAIFASVTKEELLRQELVVPTRELIRQFEDVSKPIDLQITTLWLSNEKLREVSVITPNATTDYRIKCHQFAYRLSTSLMSFHSS